MEPLCDFCGLVRALVYCKSDAARLCLQCDNCVHSANSLSRRHPRSLLCDKCNSQPATARCMFDKMYLCEGCELNGNGCSSGQGHSCQKLSSYTGCPPVEQLAKIWSAVLGQSPSPSSLPVNPQFSPMSSLNINEKSVGNCLDVNQGHEGQLGLVASKLNELAASVKFDPWLTNPSSVIPQNLSYIPSCKKDQTPFLPEGSSLTKDDPNLNNLRLTEGKDLCGGVSLDDVALSFDAGYEMFGCTTQDQTKYRCDEGDLDCLVMEKNLSVTESNSHMENAFEATSSVKQDCITFQSSQVGGSANLMQAMSTSNCLLLNPSCNRGTMGLGFPTGQVHSNMSVSLSNITGESSAADYQDCGLSPVFLTGESPWESNFESTPQARDKAKMRYNEKKKTRTFGKQIRYASRKARADTRKRVKGRFVKAGEAYDYDPLMTRDF